MSLCAACEPPEFRHAALSAVKEVIGVCYVGAPDAAGYCPLCDLLAVIAQSPERALGVHAVATTVVRFRKDVTPVETPCWLLGPHRCLSGSQCAIAAHVNACAGHCEASSGAPIGSSVSLRVELARAACRLLLEELGPSIPVDLLRSLLVPPSPDALASWLWQCASLLLYTREGEGGVQASGPTPVMALITSVSVLSIVA